MGGEVTLRDALEQVDSNSITERTKGLENLKHVLRSNKRYDALSNDAFHHIYETLFRVAVAEQSTYLKAKTPTARSAAEKRLTLCGTTLRYAVESGVRYIKLKTVRSVFDHITETLRLPSGSFCEPFALDYAKCLRSLVGYQPHAEHLTKEDRERIAAFCVECITTAESELAYDAAPGAELASAVGTSKGLSYRSSRSNFKDSAESQGSRSLAKQLAEEMVSCISLLTAPQNASPGRKAGDLLSALIGLLQNGTIGGSSPQDAFAAINHILAWTRTEDTELTRQYVNALIRLLKNYWSAKSTNDRALVALRNELLLCWMYLQPYTWSATYRQDDLTIRSELSSVLDAIRSEYSNRSERRQLLLDDLRLQFSDDTTLSNSIETAVFSLHDRKIEAESNWVTVGMLASLCQVLSNQSEEGATSDDEDDDERPRKRQRITNEFEDTLKSSVNDSNGARTAALQTLAFLAQQKPFGIKQLMAAIDKLCASCADDNATISSWAMVALTSFASQAASSSESLSHRWNSVWQIALRALSNASTCRAACHLLRVLIQAQLIPQHNITDLIQTMTSSVDLNGPTILADSVCHLLILLLRVAEQTNPASSNTTAESILSWACRHFWPSKLVDRAYASQNVLFRSSDVIELVSSGLGQHRHITQSHRFPVWGPAAQVWLECRQHQDLIDYLLLLSHEPKLVHHEVRLHTRTLTTTQPRFGCEAFVLSHLISEMYRTQEEWNQALRDKPRAITLDSFASFCKSCLTAACLAFCHAFRDSRRQTQLQKQIKDLLGALADFVASPVCEQEKVDEMLSNFSFACTGLVSVDSEDEVHQCEQHICQTILRGVSARRNHLESNGVNEGEDELELDDGFDSQSSRPSDHVTPAPEFTSERAARFSTVALRTNVTTYATALTAQMRASASTEEADATGSTDIVDYVLNLPETSMLLSSNTLSKLANTGVAFSVDDSSRLLEHCADKILPSYLYERSEVALSAILDLMSSLAHILTHRDNKSLYGLGIDLYNWYTSIALKGGVLSPGVQKRVATLLLQFCHVDTDYGRDDENDVPSVRTSLFKLVELGTITVQHFLANRISTIFGLFVLSNHPAMFDDLQESLPANLDCTEGMAMRLLFLAKLASSWHSLLRQCVYYIFETAGRVHKSTQHASRSIAELARSLKFNSPRQLFHLFSPQLLHTWLESFDIASLPYQIFQYESLEALIHENQSEITAQLLVRENNRGLETVTDTLKTTTKELVVPCFAKCLAYSIGWDVGRSSRESTNDSNCETRLRNLFASKDEYKLHVKTHFAAVMGHFYLSLQQEDVNDKWLDKKANYAVAAKALAELKGLSHSDRILPPSQQPCFKSKYLCDQIERLCRRTGDDPVKPWKLSTFAIAVRMLLDSIEDALGPLHACRVIRKLRLLICMAGDAAICSFPLEMTIHTLRPFLGDSQCADDVMGVLQYLFQRGQPYLQSNLRFLHGTVTLMILQMSKHSGTRLESTTQESQHQATVQKMRSFQAWLVQYLQKCQHAGKPATTSSYARVAKALQNLNLPGNARSGSPESSLLLLLLGNDGQHEALVSDTDRNEALVLLSDRFEPPQSVADDCLELDSNSIRFANPLWRIVCIPGLSETFQEWAACVLGRTYASTGVRPSTVIQLGRIRSVNGPAQYKGIEKSQATIARRLADGLFSRTRAEASLADYTLRSVLMSFDNRDDAVLFEQMLPSEIVTALIDGTHGYKPFHALHEPITAASFHSLQSMLEPSVETTLEEWAQHLSVVLCRRASNTAILPALIVALQNNCELALELLPCIVHLLLMKELEYVPTLRVELSKTIAAHFDENSNAFSRKQQYLIELLLYLREQAYPGERTHADRLRWLDIDWLQASEASVKCGMSTAALLFAESAPAVLPASGARRSSTRTSMSQMSITQIPQDLLLSIFSSIEEPDSFYGVEQPASLDSVLRRLDYEADGYRSLMFRSAQNDTRMRQSQQLTQSDSAGIVRSLSMLNLNSLTFALLSGGYSTINAREELLNTARRLHQWDIITPTDSSGVASNSFAAFQELSRASERPKMQLKLRSVVLKHLQAMTINPKLNRPSHEWFSGLASLAEMSETISCRGSGAVDSIWSRMQQRQSWMSMGNYDNFNLILSNRHTIFSVLTENDAIRTDIGIERKECRKIEIQSLLEASHLARQHGRLQEALAASNQCSALITETKEMMLEAEVAAKVEIGTVLWDLGEITASVNMLHEAHATCGNTAGQSGLLAQLAHQLAEARLERPDEILTKYLKPAISQLQSRQVGGEAGRVFNEFATFCDKQLQSAGNVEDFDRIVKLRDRKTKDLEELYRLHKSAKKSGAGKDYSKEITKAKQWVEIDDADYQRLKKSRDTFMEQSLQNYLRALHASDAHDISILRFFALWLENSEVASTYEIVNKHLPAVPSWKFVVLLNQLMSRLEQDGSMFQTTLKALAVRICSEHPYHSLHHLFAATREPSSEDQSAMSRYRVSMDIQAKLLDNPTTRGLLKRVFEANEYYHELANEPSPRIKQGNSIAIKDMPRGLPLLSRIPALQVPPATINLPLEPSGNYQYIPSIHRFRSAMQIMSGNSKPKRLIALASNGESYMQLLKSGEDLRQDAIMEQVFGEVSKMLQNHKATQQRSLHVRTYKVIPLSTEAGIIEFVPNSIAFQSFLISAHERYHPQDMKNDEARARVAEAKDKPKEARVKAFQKICDNLQPVMRHFFLERYKDPDEWFEKRTAYTRTTATISILGYVLGLGDRHCQNIMLDEKTGEVVHIDLGIAFEAGRVLPVPELVPFRLSRDVVDGMGITKAEGVFRRCCEFTMDALREDKDSIMTLLNVLRYDPLYTWTVSPLRAKRMQEESGRQNAAHTEVGEGSSKKKEQEAGEADRALSIVERKLSKTLSTAATVNELIQQATDVRNLATLFSGWSAWL